MKFKSSTMRRIMNIRRKIYEFYQIKMNKETAIKFYYYLKVAEINGIIRNNTINRGFVDSFMKGTVLGVHGNSVVENRYRKLFNIK